MNIVLQNKKNLEFIKTTAGEWTASTQKAHVFASSVEALYFSFDHHLRNMQIVMKSLDSKMNSTLRVSDAFGPT